MRMSLKEVLLSIFLDYTTEGERIVTRKHFEYDSEGNKYLARKDSVVKETGKLLQTSFYSPGSNRPYAIHVLEPFVFN